MKKVLILGGYGNFGKRISTLLAKENVAIIIAGRNGDYAEKQAKKIKTLYPKAQIETLAFDVEQHLSDQLKKQKPYLVINTCGPFQSKNYAAALACIQHKIHYIDLADARDFVTQITTLDEQAKKAAVLVISGASTVPGLSSAVLDHFKDQFATIESLKYGITPGQKTQRGLATTKAVLSYLGKAFKPTDASNQIHYGWQDIYQQDYPVLGKRWMANCEIPDLDLLPKHYHIKNIQFSAGMESSCLHLGMWLTSWLIRYKWPINLPKHAQYLLKISHWFDRFGTEDGGMHMIMKGLDQQNHPKTIRWFIIAKSGHGPYIPTMPAVILAKKLLQDKSFQHAGAYPCVGLINLESYLKELACYDITTYVR